MNWTQFACDRGPSLTQGGHGASRWISVARPRSLLTNTDDRLPPASLGRIQGGDGVVEGRDVANVCSQSSVPHPLDNLTQLGAIGLDDEVDRTAVVGPRHGRAYDGHHCSSGSNQACRLLADIAA